MAPGTQTRENNHVGQSEPAEKHTADSSTEGDEAALPISMPLDATPGARSAIAAAGFPSSREAPTIPIERGTSPPRSTLHEVGSVSVDQAEASPPVDIASEAGAQTAPKPTSSPAISAGFGEQLAKLGADSLSAGPAQPVGPGSGDLSAMLSGLSQQQATAPIAHMARSQQAPGNHSAPDGVPVSAVPVEIGLRSLAGVNRFDIRLAPDDLGRIEVRLDISEEGRVKTHIVVERPDALASLQREVPQLERALSQAGLSSGQDGISMSLRQQGQGGAGERERGTEPSVPTTPHPHDESDRPAPPFVSRYSASRTIGIDRHV